MKKLRVGVIGTGMIGSTTRAVPADAADVEVVAVADIREDEAKRVAEAQGCPMSSRTTRSCWRWTRLTR